MIVADTKLLAYLFLPSPATPAAEALFRSDPEWVAPRLWRSEFRNVLVLYLRRGLVDSEQAFAIQEEAERPLRGRGRVFPSCPPSRDVPWGRRARREGHSEREHGHRHVTARWGPHNAVRRFQGASQQVGMMETPSQFEVLSRDVLELSMRSHHSAYDCEFVALAVRSVSGW